MVYDYHVVLSGVGIAAGLLGYVLYYRSILAGATKPHIFSWLTYVLVDSVAFAGALVKGAGPGAWPVFLGVVANAGICILALRRGERRIRKSDWISFAAALFGIVLWVLTNDPLAAVVIVSLVNVFALYPTFRKAYVRPYEESITVWSWDLLRFGLSVFALSSFNLTTALFPVSTVFLNSSLIGMVLLRRRRLGRLRPNTSV